MQKGEPMKKVIYLEDAINEIARWIGYLDKDMISRIQIGLERLPTAQLEIIRCKDCKHHWTYKCMDSMPIEICELEQTIYDAEHDFCSMAGRKKK